MHLAIAADQPIRADDDSRIEQDFTGTLGDAGDDVKVQPCGGLHPGLCRRPAGDLFGKRSRLGTVLKHIAGVAQLRQDGELRTLAGCLFHEGDGPRDIFSGLAEARLHLDDGDGDGGFLDLLRHRVCSCCVKPFSIPMGSGWGSICLFEHDLFRKPDSTFRGSCSRNQLLVSQPRALRHSVA